jgi:hypothetical protein
MHDLPNALVWVYQCTTLVTPNGERIDPPGVRHPGLLTGERRCGRLDLGRVYTDEEFMQRTAVDEEAPCPDCGGYDHEFVAFRLVPA